MGSGLDWDLNKISRMGQDRTELILWDQDGTRSLFQWSHKSLANCPLSMPNGHRQCPLTILSTHWPYWLPTGQSGYPLTPIGAHWHPGIVIFRGSLARNLGKPRSALKRAISGFLNFQNQSTHSKVIGFYIYLHFSKQNKHLMVKNEKNMLFFYVYFKEFVFQNMYLLKTDNF